MYVYNVKVLAAIDGDTIECDVDLGLNVHKIERLRLSGVDTPELTSQDPAQRAHAQAAKDFVVDKLREAIVVRVSTEKPYSADKYGRWLGLFSYQYISDNKADSWRCLNTDLLTAGHAKPYAGGKR